MPLPLNHPVGAFTNLTIAAINSRARPSRPGRDHRESFLLRSGQWPRHQQRASPGESPASPASGPVQSLAAGYNLLRSGYNDVLVLIGNGQSSGSARIHATFTWSKNAAHLIGVCAPSAISQRARIANGTARCRLSPISSWSRGNGCLFSNLSWFQGFAAGVAAEICMTITGQRNAFLNCDFEGMGDATGATDAGSRCILIKGGGGELFQALQHRPRYRCAHQRQFSGRTQSGIGANYVRELHFPVLLGRRRAVHSIQRPRPRASIAGVCSATAFSSNAIGSAATAAPAFSNWPRFGWSDCAAMAARSVGFTNQADDDATTMAQVYIGSPASSVTD